MKSFGLYLLKKGLKIVANLKNADLAAVTAYIIKVAKEDIENDKKLEKVILYANDTFVDAKYQWITTALIEILYAIAKKKGVIS